MPEFDTEETLSALDPDLPLIASRAAIELDTLIRNKATELSFTKRLASRLSKSFKGTEDEPRPQFLVDPATATLVTRAFQQSQWTGTVRTVNDLFTEASKIAVSLENPRENSDRKTLEEARAFCAALAESAASYLQSRYSQFPTHPFRH